MQIDKTPFHGLLCITPSVHEDDRGVFFEMYSKDIYKDEGVLPLIQFNESYSKKHVLRGLHMQLGEYAQGKLVQVHNGAIRDYVVDVRLGSDTFGKHFNIELNAENKIQLWVPPGFAHGFLSLEDSTHVLYGCSAYYNPASEVTLAWNDPSIDIEWGEVTPIVSKKDRVGMSFKELEKLLRE